jgi:HPt (histidine-containing phosphotransfer) domain-containing protein
MGLTAQALQRIRDAVGDDDEILADILQSFVDEVDTLLDKLSVAAETGDAGTLRRVAHTLKSSCRDLGDQFAADLCASLEHAARDGEIADAGGISASITSASRSLKSEVVEYLAKQQQGGVRQSSIEDGNGVQ